jgi:hypothetical protein
MEAASIDWEQDLLSAQRPYVERQLRAGVLRTKVVTDLVGMGADASRAAFFVEVTAKEMRSDGGGVVRVAVPAGMGGYLGRAGAAAAFGVALSALLVLAIQLGASSTSTAIGVPSLSTVARIEIASMLPAIVVAVVLRRTLAPSLRWRPVIAGVAALLPILLVRFITLAEVAHESVRRPALSLLGAFTSGHVLGHFVTSPTDVYVAWDSTRLAPLVLWDAGFIGLCAFVAIVFSRHPAEP